MTPEFLEFWAWWNEALPRLKARPGFGDWSWDRLACMLLWMNVNEEDAP